MSTYGGELQSRIAAYMSRQRTRQVTLDELCQAIPSANRNTLSVALSKIVAGEARPYPIIRSGRGTYTWVHDPADRPAQLAVLAEMIGYMTGADNDHAAWLARLVLDGSAGVVQPLDALTDTAVEALRAGHVADVNDALYDLARAVCELRGRKWPL